MEDMEDISETSDSEDDLEETPAFIQKYHLENDADIHVKKSQQKPSRIDAILAEHRRDYGKQKKLQDLRDQLLTEIASNNEERYKEDNQELASEHADYIEQLKVKSIKLRVAHPGLPVFNTDSFCCLFSDRVDPLTYFTTTVSTVDKIWLNFSFESLMFISIIIGKASASPNFNGAMQWLLDLLSIHNSDSTAAKIEETMISVINHLQLKRKTSVCWKPSALGLLRLLVNLGADPQELTEVQKSFTQEEIRDHLTKDSRNVNHLCKEKVNSDRVRAVLTVLTLALKERCVVAKEELNLTFYMLAKASLDTSLDGNLATNFRQCFASIIDHYDDCDWPAVVPELCWQLSHITDHHHNQVYLADLLMADHRGGYLQQRVCYTFLYKQLTSWKNKFEDSQLLDVQLGDVAELGTPVANGQPSTLAVKLHNLVNTDCYRAFSILKLLDMFVGDISSRAATQKKELEYLLSQVTLVRKTIRDRVCDLDLSKVKDLMYDMTVKWSLGLQDQRMNEGSFFPWATATTHQLVKPEILMDKKEQNLTEKMEDNLTQIEVP